MSIRIIADRNIPQVAQVFAHIGEVQLVDGRRLQTEQLADAQMLLVRSVTRVNKALLHESDVHFVGSATIGTDHVDLDYLQAQGISFCNAPGCNAVSAAEYVVAAVLEFVGTRKISPRGLVVGIVGCGNVGSRVASRLAALGCELRIYDPPRQQRFADRVYVDWEQILNADIVTAHVPLTKTGDYPTYQMFDQAFFSRLHDEALFINTSRGWAVDESALKQILATGKPLQLILDVWRNEPEIDTDLMNQTFLATPHIAGYSAEGKYRGLEMIYHAACQYLGVKPQWSLSDSLAFDAPAYAPNLTGHDLSVVREVVSRAYDITLDDRALRSACELPESQRGSAFDRLRKHYPERREFPFHRIAIPAQRTALADCLGQLGFNIVRTEREV